MTKNKIASIALILMLAMTISLVALPAANARTPPMQKTSYCFMAASPNPVGVGQPTYISMWVDHALPGILVDNDIRRINYTLTITDPDGGKQTLHWDRVEDTTGIQSFAYTPAKIGTYTLKFEYGGQVYIWNQKNTPGLSSENAAWENDTFLPDSRTITLTVREEPLPNPITSYPLPTEYWTRPIEAQNTDWWTISSNWLGGPYIPDRVQPYGTAPNAPHIMWTKPLDAGGVVGGLFGDIQGEGFYMGGSYNTRWSNKVIMNGVLYYELPLGNQGRGGGTIAVDLRTGEEIWYNPDIGAFTASDWRRGSTGTILPSISFGYYIDVNDPNQHGVTPPGILFSSDMKVAYNPLTGRIQYNTTGVPSGTMAVGSKGEVLSYIWSSSTKRLALWNFSRLFTYWWAAEPGGHTPTYGVTLNMTHHMAYNTPGYNDYVEGFDGTAYNWNISVALGPGTWTIDRVSNDNIILFTQGASRRGGTDPNFKGFNITAVSLKPDSRGSVLWTKFIPQPAPNCGRSMAGWDPNAGVFLTYDNELLAYNAWDLTNGEHLWGPTEAWNDYEWFTDQAGGGYGVAAYGNYYHANYQGVMQCWDIKTGDLKWTYGSDALVEGNSTFDTQQWWGYRPIFISTVADGKIYLLSTEHSPNTPLYKDALVRCVNATDGTEVWSMFGWGTGMSATSASMVADGFLVYLNCYDMQVYCVGKGPSAMTVEAPLTGAKLGDAIVIRGTVTDTAAGTNQNEQAARFPNGVPAVSDASMGPWMEYVYMQKPRPTNVTGVEVTLSVLDSNNNYREIGKTTTNSDGFYTLNWKPDIEGQYTVYASFAGSESYWPSHAVTSFAVDPAVQTQLPEFPPQTDNTMTIVGVGAAILIAIVVGFIALALLLRKRA